MDNFRKYHKSVFKRAISDTYVIRNKLLSISGLPEGGMMCLGILTLFFLVAVTYLVKRDVHDTLEATLISIAVFFLTFVSVFFYNLLMAPSKIDEEKAQEIIRLSQKIEKRLNYKKAYESLIEARNKGALIAKGNFGLNPLTEIEDWVSKTIITMKELGLPLVNIRFFENPHGMTDRHKPLEQVEFRMNSLEMDIRNYMEKSDGMHE